MSGESEKEQLAEGTLISHLLELRDRLIRCVIAVAIAAAPCLYYQNPIYDFVAKPIQAQMPAGSKLIATGIVSPFMAPFKLACIVGLLIAIPYVLWQIWGLSRRVSTSTKRNSRFRWSSRPSCSSTSA